MSTFLERLVAEKNELDERIEKLESFLASDKISTIDTVQATLLSVQAKIMHSYSQVLLERIARLS